MKKTDGRSKAARAAKLKAHIKALNEIPSDYMYTAPEEAVKIGGTSILGRRYAPLEIDAPIGEEKYSALEYAMKNKLDPYQYFLINSISCFRTKGGIEDLEKAKHVIDMLIEFERGI